jgi:hypothetical protein
MIALQPVGRLPDAGRRAPSRCLATAREKTMSDNKSCNAPRNSTRRDFLKTAAAGAALANLGIARMAHAAGSDLVRIGFVGCGGRGTGACRDALNTSQGPVKLVAMGDLFADRLERSLEGFSKIESL